MSHPMKAYQRVRITTASPGEIIVMLLEGLSRMGMKAADHLDEKRYPEAGGAVQRAIDIMTALRESLNHDAAPTLSKNLDTTYVRWSTCLLRAQAERDTASIREIVRQIEDVLTGWRQVVIRPGEHG